MIACAVLQELTIAVAQVVDETLRLQRLRALRARARRGLLSDAVAAATPLGVAADETFVSFPDDPRLAAPVKTHRTSPAARRKQRSHLIMAVFTTARTTAFIPALSPPEVRTASFILELVLIVGGVEGEKSKVISIWLRGAEDPF